MLNFNSAMEGLISEIVRTMPEFRRVRTRQLKVSTTYNQSSSRGGLLAYLLPLKYKDGRPTEKRVKGRDVYHYGMVPVYENGIELLYIIYFMLPRFMNLSLREKLETVIHELYHINPHFNGDVRRLKGRSYLHGNSLKDYDALISKLTDNFLSRPHNVKAYDFLKSSYRRTEKAFGSIRADHMVEPKPTLLKVAKLKSAGQKKRKRSSTQLELF